LWATLLLVAFSFPLIGPALFASDAQSNLPSCCRREGKHHCGMASMAARDADPTGPVLHTSRCAQSTPGLIGSSRAIVAAVASHPAGHAQAEILFHISYSRSGQKRGPPALLPLT